jgi:hypothetical protein
VPQQLPGASYLQAEGDPVYSLNWRLPVPEPYSAARAVTPHPARVYDYFVGGDNGLDADRAAGAWIQATAPDLIATMQENKAFTRRAIKSVAELEIKQFIDIGAGFPNYPNTHEIVQSIERSGKVVYTDNDPAVAYRMEAFLAGKPGMAFVQSDILEPEILFAEQSVTGLIDFDQPVACMIAAVLHFIPEQLNPAGIAASLRAALPRGSYLILSHLASDIPWDPRNNIKTLQRATADLHPRSKPQVMEFFGDFELIAPGLVHAAEWRPTHELQPSGQTLAIYAGVARKQ